MPRALREIEIRPASSGAPEVFIANEPAAVTVSISHRSGAAICAVAMTGVELGCDQEVIEARSEAFVADYFTESEQALVARVCEAERSRLVTLLWSAKESALKALREGLRLDTRSVTVSPINGGGRSQWLAPAAGCVPMVGASRAGGSRRMASCGLCGRIHRRTRRFSSPRQLAFSDCASRSG